MSTTTPDSLGEGDDAFKPSQAKVQRALINSTAIVMCGTLLSRVLGLVRDRVIAGKFGQGYETDVYNAAFTIPDIIFYLIAGGALSSAFIPVFTEYIEQKKEKEAWRVFSIVASMTVIVVGALIALGLIFLDPLVRVTNPGWVKHLSDGGLIKINETVRLTRILLPVQICFFLGGLMMGALQVKKNSFGQAFGPVIYNLGIILGGVFLGSRYGPAGLCWGAVGGAILGNLVLQWILVRKVGGFFSPMAIFKYWGHPGAKQVWSVMWPIIFSLSLPQVCQIVNKGFASFLDSGEMSGLLNANRLMQVPLGIFAQALSVAILPTMSQQVAQMDMAGLKKTLNFGIRFVLFLTIPSSVFMMVLALPIVQLILQNGKFHKSDAQFTAWLLIFYCIGLFAWSAQTVIARGFYSMKDSRTPAIVGTAVTALFVIGNVLALKIFHHGSDTNFRTCCALAFVTSWAAILNAGILLLLLNEKLKGIHASQLFVSFAKVALASVAMGVACHFAYSPVYRLLSGFSVIAQSAGTLLACGAVGVAVFGGMALLMKMEETSTLVNLVRKAARR